jgi:hypothetical protein
MRAKQCLSIHLQNRVRDVASDIVKVVLNAFGGEGSDRSFHVVCFVVDGEVEAALPMGGTERVTYGQRGR